MNYCVGKASFPIRAKRCKFVALLRVKAGFLMRRPKTKMYIWCIITFRSRFSHDAPKTLIFDALLCGKAGFFMMRQKGANLMHYDVLKQVFSWHAKHLIFDELLNGKSKFSHDAPQGANLLHYYVLKQVFRWRDQKQSVYLMHFYVS